MLTAPDKRLLGSPFLGWILLTELVLTNWLITEFYPLE